MSTPTTARTDPITDPPEADGPPLRLGPALAAGFAAYLRLLGDASAVVVQQELDLGLVPTLAEDQALAASHAADWLTRAAPTVLVSLLAVGGHARVVQAFAAGLGAHADDVDAGADAAPFLRLCAALRSQVADRVAAVTAAGTGLAARQQFVEEDDVRFGKLGAEVPAAYAPDLAHLRSGLDALRGRMEHDNAVITGAAAHLLPGLATLGLAAGLTVVDLAQAKVVVQKGYKMIAGADEEVRAAMADAAEAVAAYRTTLTALALARAELAAFTIVAGNVTRLVTTTQGALCALTALATGWQDEDGYLLWLGALAQDARGDESVRGAVDALVARWDDLLTTTDAILPAALRLEEPGKPTDAPDAS